MTGAGRGAGESSRARVSREWEKIGELVPIPTNWRASLKLKGSIYSINACVQRVLVYGSEAWPMKTEDLQRLERAECMMWRWMC